ncbi:peptidoglycan recognition protein family protein [Actinomadura opuntiae]|uniref:peptidoglycan recognition protein family protein n=1 Tax=Actinomadura sp. OS1-43 TaxID=604315 RepID=UPI00255B052D|nr:peptidoglycan recognition protein [Actinomadura sp. OS1-43]MDL4820471.1 peptidoglycan recognition protein [Actinomadura sp. OS1-43]
MLRRTLVGASVAALVVGGTVTYLVSDGSDATTSATVRPGPGPGRVSQHALRDLTAGTAAKKVAGLPAASTERFSLLGVTWDKPRSELRGTVRVRTRDAASGRWSGWRDVEPETEDAPDSRESAGPGSRGGTSGLWVGPSNGVEVRVTGHGRTLPAGLRVDLVDPGDGSGGSGTSRPRAAGEGGTDVRLAAATEPVDSPAPDASSSPTPEPSASTSAEPAEPPSPSPSASTSTAPSPSQRAAVSAAVTAPKPAMVSRAAWGADESLVKEPPEYDTSVKAVFVHHSDTGNSYTCAESPSVVRSIFLYHVKSEGWNDIGYNFLVDKCGTVYEGRGGGVDRPVHGAHTYGFNTDTAGIAVLGTYTNANETPAGVAPTQAALNGVAKVAAWKLGLTGVDPTGKTTLTSAAPNGTGGKYPYGQKVSFNTISGHRDGFATACPGAQLYAKLGDIRTAAKKLTTPAVAVTLTGAANVGGRYYTKSAVTVGWKPVESATYQVRVDGTVAATPAPGASSAALTLQPGTHSVVVHATYGDGSTADSPASTVVADVTKPVFATPPALSLRRATVSTTAVPVTLGWKATDNALLTSVKATSPAAKTFAGTATSWAATAKPGAAQSWSLTAADAAGNTAASGISRSAALMPEGQSKRTGTWKKTTNSSYLGGYGLYSASKGASASWTFTGREAGLVVKRQSNVGAVVVYVDGVKAGTLDTRASTLAYRQLAWTRSWKSSGQHTIKVVVAGTSGRPTVCIDGIAYLR